jgi:hypothetical protein
MLKIGHRLLRVSGLVFWGLTLLTFACDFGSRRDKKMETTKPGDEWVMAKTASRPDIDLAIPERIETATFALG